MNIKYLKWQSFQVLCINNTAAEREETNLKTIKHFIDFYP